MPSLSTAIPDFTGRLIDNGRYRLLQEIGSGTYGVVYRALDLASFKFIARPPQRAIKIVSKAGLSKRQAQYLRREYNLHLAMSEHPNIVTLIRGFEDNDFAYFVLDYCPGGDLFNRGFRQGFYWRKDALLKSIFLQIINALEACHSRGVSHRDLKSENILTNEDGSIAYLTDFGLSTNQVISDTFGCGSAPYMSPECIGTECDDQSYSNPLSDIWSLGIIMITLINCRLPWSEALTSDLNFHKFVLDPNFFLKSFPMSKEASDIIIRTLDIFPERRITLSELRVAITNLDTFFMSDEEIASSGAEVQAIVEYITQKAVLRQPGAFQRKGLAKRKALPKLAVRNKFRVEKVNSRGRIVEVDLGKGGVVIPHIGQNVRDLALPPPLPPRPQARPKPVERQRSGSVDITSLIIPDVSSSASTDESAAPVTPETFPVNPDVEVSELEDDLGMATLSSQGQGLKPRPLRVVNVVGPIINM